MKQQEYIPFGEEWKKEVMKHSKEQIIELFTKPALMKLSSTDEKVKEIKMFVAQKINSCIPLRDDETKFVLLDIQQKLTSVFGEGK